MVYGDLQFFDIIIFAAIAAFLIFRLRNVLGKRTGLQKTPQQSSQPTNENNNVQKNTQAPELPENFVKLKTAYELLENFDHNAFLDGAKAAFETIIVAFNNGDKKTLKPLLVPNVYKSFEQAIDADNINKNYQFYSLNIESIDDVKVANQIITITIKFISEQFKDNDEKTVVKKQDLWTFEKDIKSKNPAWLLSAT